jgi:hypothetical protein
MATAVATPPAVAATQSTTTVAAALPPNWVEYSAPDGRKYYHNTVTSETTWEKPQAPQPQPKQLEQKVGS